MPEAPRKAPFACPECGHVQQESPHLISTYCRSCGMYYEVRAAGRSKSPAASPSRRAPRLVRPVRCHHCGETHEVSSHAQSTMCPGCSASISFEDVIIGSHVSRPIDTRGRLVVEESGNLNTTLAVCGDAEIRGKISGVLQAEGSVRLHAKGRLGCRITAKSVIVEHGARIEFIHPLETGSLEIFGGAAGRFACSGGVKVKKGGVLEGRFHARSIVVEKGGILVAESVIDPEPPDPQSAK